MSSEFKQMCCVILLGSNAGLVTEWEQQSGKLLASGDVKKIRVWDAHREMKVQVDDLICTLSSGRFRG